MSKIKEIIMKGNNPEFIIDDLECLGGKSIYLGHKQVNRYENQKAVGANLVVTIGVLGNPTLKPIEVTVQDDGGILCALLDEKATQYQNIIEFGNTSIRVMMVNARFGQGNQCELKYTSDDVKIVGTVADFTKKNKSNEQHAN